MNLLSRYRRQLLGLLVLAVFAVYFVMNRSTFESFQTVRPVVLAGIFCGYAGIMLTNGLFIKYIIQPFAKHMTAWESVRVALISSLGNFFAASGAGLGFRAYYLKKKHQLKYSDYLSTLYGNYLLLFIICALAGLLALMAADRQQGVQFGGALTFFIGLLVGSLGLSLVRIPAIKTNRAWLTKLLSILTTMTAGWQRIIKNRFLLIMLTGLIIAQLLLTMFIAKLETAGLGIHLSLPGLLLFAVLSSLSIFINLTPANLGVKEAIFLVTGNIIGLSTPQIIAVALLDRAVLFVTLGVLWLATGRGSWTRQEGNNA